MKIIKLLCKNLFKKIFIAILYSNYFILLYFKDIDKDVDEKQSCKLLDSAATPLLSFGIVCSTTVVTDNFAGKINYTTLILQYKRINTTK